MKKHLMQYVFPLGLLLLAFHLASTAYSSFENGAKVQGEILAERLKKERLTQSVSTPEMINAAKDEIEYLVQRHKLPIKVTLSHNTKSIRLENENPKADGMMALLSDPKYTSLMAFLGVLPGLNFAMNYDKFCIGIECTGGFEVEIKFQ